MTNSNELHDADCYCYECAPSSHFDAGYYIGSTLVSIKGIIRVYKLPSVNSPILRKVDKGAVVGVIDSYVIDKVTKGVWWALKGGGYVQHFQGYFDLKTAVNTSSGKAFQKALDDTNKINLNPVPLATAVGKDIISLPFVKYALIAAVILVMGYVALKFKK